MSIERSDRIRGGIWGLLVGDAVGVPYEFHRPEDLPPENSIDLVPPPDFARAHSGIAPGTWSDDGSQALCLLASLLHCGRVDPADLSNRLLNWASVGHMAVDYDVFDIGMQTQRAFEQLRRGVQPLLAGPSDEYANGNGSLMRVLPLALWHAGSDSDLVRDACTQSRITHGHPRAQAVCSFYCLWARALLNGSGDAWDVAATCFNECVTDHPQIAAEAAYILKPDHAFKVAGSGYVLDTLWSARRALEAHDRFDKVVKAAIALGDDTDTTACVAGGLAGIRDGIGAIPLQWLEQMRGKEMILPLLTDLIALT